MNRRRAGVLGAGMGGLAAAARLAKLGWDVTVFESSLVPGGKNTQGTLAGPDHRSYRFDLGPSLLTMPEVFRELWSFCGKDFDQDVTLVPLDPLCHYWWDDGSRTAAPGSPQGFIEHFSALGWAPRKNLEKFFRRAQTMYQGSGQLFLESSLREWSSYASRGGWKAFQGLPSLDPFHTLDQAHRRYFTDPRLVQLFNRYATYNGSSPFKAPATLDIIPWVEYGLGGWGVKEGIYGLSQALVKLGTDLGVQWKLGAPVERILTDQGRITGLESQGQRYDFDLVVSNADVQTTYQLLGDSQAPQAQKYLRQEPSSSGLVFYWGLKDSFPELGLHNIFFSQDYEKEFSQIFQGQDLPQDPTVYINITSKIAPRDAPQGAENWFVLINVPRHQGQDWQTLGDLARERILYRVEKSLGKKVASSIEVEGRLTPLDIEQRTGSTGGSLYGLSSNTWNAAFLRHNNRSLRHRGLYFVGGSVHPGGGMPLVLLGARIVTTLVEKYEKENRR